MSPTTGPVVIRLLAEQRKRCLATILHAAESGGWWDTLTTAQQSQLREQVRTAIQVFYDLTRDIVKITEDDDTPRNDLVLDAIRAMHSDQRQIAANMKRP